MDHINPLFEISLGKYIVSDLHQKSSQLILSFIVYHSPELVRLRVSRDCVCIGSIRGVKSRPSLLAARDHINRERVSVLTAASDLILEHKLTVVLKGSIVLSRVCKVCHCANSNSELQSL